MTETMEPFVLTSADWCRALEINPAHMDPDGWDRANYEQSFCQEKITRQEFNSRLMMSSLWETASLYCGMESERGKQLRDLEDWKRIREQHAGRTAK